MAHEHRLTIDADGFLALVAGEPVSADCACGDRVAVLVADIGAEIMDSAYTLAFSRIRGYARGTRDLERARRPAEGKG